MSRYCTRKAPSSPSAPLDDSMNKKVSYFTNEALLKINCILLPERYRSGVDERLKERGKLLRMARRFVDSSAFSYPLESGKITVNLSLVLPILPKWKIKPRNCLIWVETGKCSRKVSGFYSGFHWPLLLCIQLRGRRVKWAVVVHLKPGRIRALKLASH